MRVDIAIGEPAGFPQRPHFSRDGPVSEWPVDGVAETLDLRCDSAFRFEPRIGVEPGGEYLRA
jgi:hypothetical protein